MMLIDLLVVMNYLQKKINASIANTERNVLGTVREINPGKRFEKNFRDSLPGVIRLYDTMGETKNPGDFVYYVYPYDYIFELKSVQDDRFDFNLLSDNQNELLEYYDHIFGMTSVVCVEFRKYNKVYMIPYKVIKELNKTGKKSINYNEIENYKTYEIPTEYKRINFTINVAEFHDILKKVSKGL